VLGNKAGQTYVNTSESGAVRDISEWTVEETFPVLGKSVIGRWKHFRAIQRALEAFVMFREIRR